MLNCKILQGLNDAQREAVLHGEGPALVAAGPGSGKTFTITRRLLYLIQERNIPPEKILVITFTKEAAKTMQERFVEELRHHKVTQYSSSGFVSFGTFHSFFYQIIKQIPQYKEYQLITRAEKLKIAKEVLLKDCAEEVKDMELLHFLTSVSYYKNTGQFKDTSAYHTSKTPLKQKEQFERQFNMYETLKHKYKRVDFDDMLFLCKNKLKESQKLLEHWQKQFTYILVDEAQDINPIQYELLKLLTIPPYNLYLVGDDDQAIYGFRGSKSDIFQEFLNDFPATKQIVLVQNYRCSQEIVEASKRLIERNKTRLVKELVSVKGNGLKGKIHAFGSITTKASYHQVIEQVLECAPEKRKEQAVLFRTNFSMQTFAACLAARNIPFVMREKIQNIYEHFVVKDILDYFNAASGQKERSLYLRIFQKLSIPLGREALVNEKVDLNQVKEIYSNGFYENSKIYEEILSLERNLNRLKNMRPALGIKFILHAMGYQNYLFHKASQKNEFPEDWQQVLVWLMEDAEDYIDFKNWNIHIQECKTKIEKESFIAGTTLKESSKEGIHLLTLHAAKGLEFQKVYIMGLNEGNIPQLRRGEAVTEERIEEERRLFYVGMTRAKEELALFYVTGTKERPTLASRFLEEIKPCDM